MSSTPSVKALAPARTAIGRLVFSAPSAQDKEAALAKKAYEGDEEAIVQLIGDGWFALQAKATCPCVCRETASMALQPATPSHPLPPLRRKRTRRPVGVEAPPRRRAVGRQAARAGRRTPITLPIHTPRVPRLHAHVPHSHPHVPHSHLSRSALMPQAVESGKLLRMHQGDERSTAWMITTTGEPPPLEAASTRRNGSRAHGGAPSGVHMRGRSFSVTDEIVGKGHLNREIRTRKRWKAKPEESWRISFGKDSSTQLLNRGSGGFLNVRPHRQLRGHGNSGPPWTAATAPTGSTRFEMRLAPQIGRLPPLTGNESEDGEGSAWRREPEFAKYGFLSVDFHIATAQARRARASIYTCALV